MNRRVKAKPIKICVICGDRATGINFNALTCMSCKAFFRRNALRQKVFQCPFEDTCSINRITRKFCAKCRIRKCFDAGMKKEWILSDTEKREMKERIARNRELKKERMIEELGLCLPQTTTATPTPGNPEPTCTSCQSTSASKSPDSAPESPTRTTTPLPRQSVIVNRSSETAVVCEFKAEPKDEAEPKDQEVKSSEPEWAPSTPPPEGRPFEVAPSRGKVPTPLSALLRNKLLSSKLSYLEKYFPQYQAQLESLTAQQAQ